MTAPVEPDWRTQCRLALALIRHRRGRDTGDQIIDVITPILEGVSLADMAEIDALDTTRPED